MMRYTGTWYKGLRHGEGELESYGNVTGELEWTYKGEFARDKIEGFGVRIDHQDGRRTAG